MKKYEFIRLIGHFKDGDKIVCIDDDCVSELKKGTVYITLRFNTKFIFDYPMAYNPRRFVPLQAYRRIKLKELMKCSE